MSSKTSLQQFDLGQMKFRKKASYGGPQNSWETPGIEDLGNFRYSIKIGDDVKLYNCASLSELFSTFAYAVTKFAHELEMEPEGFVATAIHSFVWPTPGKKQHNIYTQISGQAGYVEQTKYPRYLKNAIWSTWQSPGEEFSDDVESDKECSQIIKLNDSDPNYKTE